MSEKYYPWIDPVLFKLAFFELRWYSIAYILGFICAYIIALKYDRTKNNPPLLSGQKLDSLFNISIISVIVGGRLGYVLFYNLPYYAANPALILQVWQGGMSFHGAVLGLSLAFYIFARQNKLSFLALTDLLCISVGPGIMFGRIANFINGELWGAVCQQKCIVGAVFPLSGTLQIRYATQLYESFFEGLLIFVVLVILSKKTKIFHIRGLISSLFFILYGVFRFFIEYIREPDEQLGRFFNILSMGQILCLVMISVGSAVLVRQVFVGRSAPNVIPTKVGI